VDETGHPDGPPAGANGNGSGDRRDSRLRDWARAIARPAVPADAGWSDAGAAVEPPAEPVVPGWRTVGSAQPAYGRGYADLLDPIPGSPGAGGTPPPRQVAELEAPEAPPADYQPWSPPPAPPPTPVVPAQYAVPPLPPQHVPAIPPLPPPPGGYGSTPPSGLPAYGRPVNGSRLPEDFAAPPRDEATEQDVLSGPPAEPAPRAAGLPQWVAGLPQRVPAEPDVPTIPEPMTEEVEERAEVPELARIATYLRHEEPAGRLERRESLDVDAVLAAVRGVYGVRDAELRTNPGGVHSLRLDLADGADPGPVSREVARLLKERLGLAAALGSRVGTAERAAGRVTDSPYQGRRRGGTGTARGRASVEPRTAEPPIAEPRIAEPRISEPIRAPAVEPSAGQPLPRTAESIRVVLDHVQVSTFGLDATVEVRLGFGERRAVGEARGPAVDGYVLRLAAVAAANALDQLLVAENTGASRGRCFVEHASLVPFGTCEVAVVVILLVCGGWVEQLAGSSLVAGDPRQAIVRATLSAVNRRMEALLP
jgi:hypothetical protein